MDKTTFEITMDKDLKKQFDECLEKENMDVDTAIALFARYVIENKGFPILVNREEIIRTIDELRKDAITNGTSDMSSEEINKEIELYRRGE